MRIHVTISALVGIFLLAWSPAFALQDTPFSFEPKIGANLSNTWGDDQDVTGFDGKMKPGIVGDPFGNHTVCDWMAVQAEVLYSQKGAKFGGESLKLDYVEIPILAMWTAPAIGRFTPNLAVGPAVGFHIRAKAEDEDIKDFIKTVDFGIAFGAGVKVDEIGPGAVTFDVRYTLGLTNVLDDAPSDLSVRNMVLGLLLGYAF